MLTYRSWYGVLCNGITFVNVPIAVVAGVVLLILGTPEGLILLLFAPVWAWHALWHTAYELTLEPDADALRWRSALTSGSIALRDIENVRNTLFDLNIALIDKRSGGHLAVYRYGGLDEFVLNAGLLSSRNSPI
jgi:hypothetical protein